MANETYIHKGFITNADSEVEGKLTADSLVAAALNYPTSDGTANQVLTTDGNGNLSFQGLPSGVTTLAALNDTNVNSLATGYILKWDGSDWVSEAPSFTISQITNLQTELDSKLEASDLSGYATETYVNNAVADVIDAAPDALDTLNELAASLNDDANFAGTMTTALAGKAPSVHTHLLEDITDFNADDYATGAEGDLATSALQPGDIGSTVQGYDANTVIDANYVATDNNFTDADHSKLDGIAAGAEVNVQANWNEADTNSDAYIQNKPGNVSDFNIDIGIGSLTNVTTAGTTKNDVLAYNGTAWVPRTSYSLAVTSDANDHLTEVDVALVSNAAAVQVDYVMTNGTSVRAGILHAVTNGSFYEISDLSTVHAGSEADLPDFTAFNAGGGNLGVQVSDANGYTIKYTVQNLLR